MKKKTEKRLLMVNKKICVTVAMLVVIGLILYGCGDADNKENKQSGTEATITENENEDITDSDNGGISNSAEEPVPTAVQIGDTAPDFTIELLDGSKFTLSEQKGKVVLLNFWASWCGPCVKEMPAFERLHQEYGDELQIVAIDGLEYREAMVEFLEAAEYTFPIAYDADSAVNMLYPSDGIPYTVIIDRDGVVQNTYVGALDAEQQYETYKAAIDELMEKQQ